ncbi:MAG: hypothetical protein HQM16_05595 [Deltaproteobacteria bacterium]|nr:hypothetical protein [Deltaproteobacteria bacterium]
MASILVYSKNVPWQVEAARAIGEIPCEQSLEFLQNALEQRYLFKPFVSQNGRTYDVISELEISLGKVRFALENQK